jgi:hypothetical protein
MFDYGNAEVAQTDSSLAKVSELVHHQRKLELDVEKCQAALDAAKSALKDVAEFELPDLLTSLGLETVSTNDGLKVTVQKKIRASIPKARESEAFAWLDANGNSHLIKRQFVIDFGKNEDAWADKFERDCAQRKKALHLNRKKSVHPSTLSAFVRKELEENGSFPEELFGVYRQKVAKIDT